MANQKKMVFSKEGKLNQNDIIKFSIHEQLAMESPSNDEETPPPPDYSDENNISKDLKAMEARHQLQLRNEISNAKENLKTDFARKATILEKEVKKVLLAILKAEPASKKYLLKIQKLMADFSKEASKD